MLLKVNKLYQFLFSFLLICQLYIESYRIIILSQIAILIGILYLEKSIDSRLVSLILPLLLFLIIPVFPLFFNIPELQFILKDFFLLVKPLVGLVIGYLIFRRINDLSIFVKTIVVVGCISAMIHLVILIFNGSLLTGNVSQIRQFSKDNFLELFAIFFLSFHQKFFNAHVFKNKSLSRILFIILLVSCLLYLSRTMIIIALILALAVLGYLKISTKTIKVITVLIVVFVGLFIYLFNTKIDRDEKGLMGFLYKVKMAPGEIFTSRIDRSNHAELWDHWRAYEANRAYELMVENPSSFVIGNGYGSLVNLKFKAPLTKDDIGIQYISEIHNGYVFILYKLGFIGLIIFFIFLYNLYISFYKKYNFVNVFMGAISVCYFFTALTITGIFNKRDVMIFILGGLLFFASKFKNFQSNESDS